MDEDELNNSGDGPLQVPGFNDIPLDLNVWMGERFLGSTPGEFFPSPLTARELEMLRAIESITDRPGWSELVFDEDTVQSWQTEIMAEYSLMSCKAWEWCVAELRDKARRFKETGQIMVFNAAGGVCKSDTIIPACIGSDIREFVSSPDHINPESDFNQQTWSLIDPSLYPLIHGRTRVLVNGGSVPLDKTLDAYGQGEVTPPHDNQWKNDEALMSNRAYRQAVLFSNRFQWLPCEVEFCGPAGSTDVRITSYVNNLHPLKQRSFYTTLENVISKVIEPWNEILIKEDRFEVPDCCNRGLQPRRIRTYGVEWENRYPEWAADLPATLDVDRSTEAYTRALERVKNYLDLPEYGINVGWWFNKTQKIPDDWETKLSLREIVDIKYSRMFRFQHSEPGSSYSYEDWKAGKTAHAIVGYEDYDNVDPTTDLWMHRNETKDPMLHNQMMRGEDEDHQFQTDKLQDTFRDRGLQIIAKLGGIELNPANPSFPSEGWHTDGLVNEHIVATAMYFFDVENVMDPQISFSQMFTMDGNQYAFDWRLWDVPYLEKLFNVKQDEAMAQDLGSVSIHHGRLLVFPNYLRHRLAPLELADKSRPGHCRYLTLWLVDPHYRICSTRNVPPQQHDWWEQEVRSHLAYAHTLPQEMADLIIAETDSWPMSLSEARKHRDERSRDETVARDVVQYSVENSKLDLFKRQ